MSLTVERLKEVLHYDLNTGLFIWLKSTNNKILIGSVAGGLDEKGYLRIKIDGKKYRAHRLAWFYVTGVWPIEIDHKDLNKSNNKFNNLREATRSQNASNGKVRKHNRSGVRGVSQRGNRFYVEIMSNKKRYRIGVYNTLEEAKEAYNKAAVKYHGEFSYTWYAQAELKDGIVVKVK